MSKTIELRKVIKTELLKICDRVYHQEADSKAQFPYVVYELSSGIKTSLRDDISLVIDVWDKGASSTNVETIADNIEKLDFTNLPNGKVYPTIYFELRNSLRDEDKSIKRRQLRFTIKNYEGVI